MSLPGLVGTSRTADIDSQIVWSTSVDLPASDVLSASDVKLGQQCSNARRLAAMFQASGVTATHQKNLIEKEAPTGPQKCVPETDDGTPYPLCPGPGHIDAIYKGL